MSLEFEKKLAYELSELGIHAQANFRVPDSDLIIDFYIKAPLRGLIEIKGTSLSNAAVAKRAEQLKNIYNKFNKSICLFIIHLGQSPQSVSFDGLTGATWYINVPDLQNNPEKYCAQNIRKAIVEQSIRIKNTELVLRIKEKEEILKFQSGLKNEEDHYFNDLHMNRKQIKVLIAEVDSLLKNTQSSSDLAGKEKEKIINLREKMAHTETQIHFLEKSLDSFEQKREESLHRQSTIDLEIESIKHQTQDLTKEAKEVDDAIIDSNKGKDVVSDDKRKPFKSKKDLIDILSQEQVNNLEKTTFTSGSSFKVINVYKVAGEDFRQYFPHLKKWYKPMQVIETDKGWFVDATVKNHGATDWQKQEYHNCRVTYSTGGEFKPLWLQKDNIFTRKPIDEGMFGDVLSSFQAFLSPDKWKVLVKEVVGFEEEYQSKHYTTAVLRIGRTLEYVIYTLVTSWGVNINRSSTSRIDKLNNNFEKLCKHLIYYYSPEKGEEKKQRARLDEAFDELTKSLNQTQRDLDVEHKVFDTDSKINIESLLREVKAEYGSQEETRNAIDNLSNSNLISNTLIKRNTAAHADHSGSKREFNEKDVKEMAEDLKKILFHLSNIHETISRSSS